MEPFIYIYIYEYIRNRKEPEVLYKKLERTVNIGLVLLMMMMMIIIIIIRGGGRLGKP